MKQGDTYAVYFVEGKNGSNQQILLPQPRHL